MPADFAPPPVFICDRCGQGFLTAQPFAIHQYPVWKVLSAGEGEICGGQISTRSRIAARNDEGTRDDDTQAAQGFPAKEG